MSGPATEGRDLDGHLPEDAERRAPLLTGGMLVCPTCGWNFETRSGRYYQCSNRRRNGPTLCKNTLRLRIREADEEVLAVVEGSALSPRAVEELLATIDSRPDAERERLERELTRLRAEVSRLVDSVEAGMPASAVADKVREREAEAGGSRPASARRGRPPRPSRRSGRALEHKTKEWREVLRGQAVLARTLLRRLVGPLRLWNIADPPQATKALGMTARMVAHEYGGAEGVRWTAENRATGEFLSAVQVGRSMTRTWAPAFRCPGMARGRRSEAVPLSKGLASFATLSARLRRSGTHLRVCRSRWRRAFRKRPRRK